LSAYVLFLKLMLFAFRIQMDHYRDEFKHVLLRQRSCWSPTCYYYYN